MRILIVSDIHANLEALQAIDLSFDQLWVLGDLVNYGPDPCAVVDFVRRHATLVVRGNHDHALAFDQDPRCSPKFIQMAQAMRLYTAQLLSPEQKAWLGTLPLGATVRLGQTSFHLCHASPRDPLFTYLPAEPEAWRPQVAGCSPGLLLVGHTHIPFELESGGVRIVNPGSLGQPKHGRPEACFAVWDEAHLKLLSRPYNFRITVDKILSLAIEPKIKQDLVAVLQTGLPPL